MDTKVLSTGVRYSNLPESYVRPESDGPRLSEVSACDDVPVIDLGLEDRSQVVKQIAEACKFYGFFQVINHGVSLEAVGKMLRIATEFFSLPVEEKLKLHSDNPSKTMRLSTSFNVNKEKVHNRRDYLRLHCYPLDKYVLEWPSNPPDFIHSSQGSSKADDEKFSASDYKSSLDGKDLEKIRKRFVMEEGIVLRLPDDGERPYSCNKGDIVLYVAYLKAGVTLPFPSFIVNILDRLGLAPSQLAPNAWRIVISFSKLWKKCFGFHISVDEFLYCYKLAKLPKSYGQWYFVAWDRDTKFTEPPKSNGSWSKEYFLVRGEAFCESVKRCWSDPSDSARERPKLDEICLGRIQKAKAFKEEEQSKQMNIQPQKKDKLPTFSQRKRKASSEMSSQETSAHRVTPPVVPNPEVQVGASTSYFVEDVLPFTVVEPRRPSKGKEVAILPTTHTDAALEMVRSKLALELQNVTDMLMIKIESHVKDVMEQELKKVLADIAVRDNLSEMKNKELKRELTMKELKKVLDDIAVRDNLSEMENEKLERELTMKDVVMEKDEHLEAAEE